jgi:hypothetical protein
MSATVTPTATAANARLAETPTQEQIEAARDVLRRAARSANHDRSLAYDAMSDKDREQMESGLADITSTFEVAMEEAESSAAWDAEASLQETVDQYGFECVKYALETGRACSTGEFSSEVDLEGLVDNCNRN